MHSKSTWLLIMLMALLVLGCENIVVGSDSDSGAEADSDSDPESDSANRTTVFFEDFASWPGDWTMLSGPESMVTGDALWHNGSGLAQILYVGNRQEDEWLISPTILIPDGTTHLSWDWRASYYWHVDPYDGADVTLQVSIDGGTTWDTAFWAADNEAQVRDSGVPWPYQNFKYYTSTADLSDFAGSSIVLGWHYYGNDGAQYDVDNITVTNTP